MVTLFIGKSGSGKDTMLNKMVAEGVTPIISYTTRPMREGEVQDKDYHFVSLNDFNKLVDEDKLSEYRGYNTLVNGEPDTWYYGTPRLSLEKDYVGVVTISGVEAFIKLYGAENINVVYMQVSDKTRERRAMLRGSFDKTEWDRRVEADKKDFSEGRLHNLEKMLGKPIRIMNNEEHIDVER